MKMKINTSTFVAAIKNLEKIPVNDVLPIIDSVKLTVRDNQAVLYRTNLEKTIIALIPADIDFFGTVILPMKTIDLIRNLKDYEFEITENNIITEKKTISYKGLDAGQYPEVHITTNEFFFEITESELNRMLEVKYCMSSDECRPILFGICFDSNKTVGIDGYRMSVRQGNYESNIKSIVIDKSTIDLLDKVINKKSNEIVKVYGQRLDNKDKQYVKFEFNRGREYTFEVIGESVPGEYMNYKGIIPQDIETTITVNSDMVSDEVEFMYKAANKDYPETVKIITTDSKIILDGRITESIYDKQASIEATAKAQKEADLEYYQRVNKLENPSGKGRKATKKPERKTVKPVKIYRQEEVNRIKAEVYADINGNTWEAGFNMKYVYDAFRMYNNTDLKLKAVSSIASLTITADDQNIELILPIRMRS
jgi:DNA polymerase III sliding clamp (beta) subunit (PCNA family)